MIIFNKLWAVMAEHGTNVTRVSKDTGISQYAFNSMKNPGKEMGGRILGVVSLEKINVLCKYFNCQPSDIMEFVEDK